jgi:uncharacterized LabA/DUF88 family protein
MDNQKEKNVGYVFIDASNLWEVQKSEKKFLDYGKLKNYLKKLFDFNEIQIFYYSAYPADGTREYSLDSRHKFYTFLKKGLNFRVRKKKLKQIKIATSEGECVREKGNMDVEITIDALHHLDKYNTAIFFSGDSDFLALVSYIRQRNKKVFIFSSERNISTELRTGADGYINIISSGEDIWRTNLKHRKK